MRKSILAPFFLKHGVVRQNLIGVSMNFRVEGDVFQCRIAGDATALRDITIINAAETAAAPTDTARSFTVVALFHSARSHGATDRPPPHFKEGLGIESSECRAAVQRFSTALSFQP